MSGLPDSHAKDGLKYDPIVTGSFVYALLTVLGLACVFGAKGFNDREIVALSAYALVDDYGFDQARAAAAAAPCPVARRGDASAR